MDKELSVRFDAIEMQIKAVYQAVSETRADLMALMNNQHERLINDLGSLRSDFVNTRDFLLRDAAGRGRQWLDLEERVAKLERRDE